MGTRTRILGISSALVSLALAGVTTATASTTPHAAPAARATAVRAAAAHAPAVAKGIRMVSAAVASVTTKPGGYKIVHSAPLTAVNGSQTGAGLSCPKSKGVQTVPLDGGALVVSSSLFVNLNSSWPGADGKSWDVDVNNASGADTTFTISVVCAKPFTNYAQFSSSPVANPANTQNRYFVTCPTGSVILGGGGFSSTSSTLVNLNGVWPSSTGTWEVDINNASSVSATVTLYEICAKLNKSKTHYQLLVGPTNDNPNGVETNSSTACPTGRSVLGGGTSSNSGSTAVNLNSNGPLNGGWIGYENNNSGLDASVTSYAICAT